MLKHMPGSSADRPSAAGNLVLPLLEQSAGHLLFHTAHHTTNLLSATCYYFYGLLMNEPLPTSSGIRFHRTVMSASAEAAQGG